jgi:hypothetical protein
VREPGFLTHPQVTPIEGQPPEKLWRWFLAATPPKTTSTTTNLGQSPKGKEVLRKILVQHCGNASRNWEDDICADIAGIPPRLHPLPKPLSHPGRLAHEHVSPSPRVTLMVKSGQGLAQRRKDAKGRAGDGVYHQSPCGGRGQGKGGERGKAQIRHKQTQRCT